MSDEAKRDPLRFLVVVAHPHDFTHCAGTCGIHVLMGDSVTVVTVTDGGRKHNEAYLDEMSKPEAKRDPAIANQTQEDYAAAKNREITEVCAVFGVKDLRILTFPEPLRLQHSPEAVDTLADIIADVRPHVLITHAPYNMSPAGITTHGLPTATLNDHRECAIMAMEACAMANMPDYEAKKQPHRIAAIYYLGVDVMPDQVDFYVDISDWKDHRQRAEALFKSQGQTEAFARKRIDIGAGSMGWAARTQYAEAFVRSQVETLPCIEVPQWSLQLASGSRIEHLKHIAGESTAQG